MTRTPSARLPAKAAVRSRNPITVTPRLWSQPPWRDSGGGSGRRGRETTPPPVSPRAGWAWLTAAGAAFVMRVAAHGLDHLAAAPGAAAERLDHEPHLGIMELLALGQA